MKYFIALLIFISAPTLSSAPMDKANLSAPLPANLWIEMSKLAQPGVVGIYLDIDIKKTNLRRDPLFDFLEEFFGQGFEYNNPDEEQSTPIGTGFIIDNEGYIVTNNHVIDAINNPRLKTKLQVQISGETQLHSVEVLGQDSRGDLALLKISKPIKNLKALELGDSDSLEVGEFVAAFGNPYGHSNSMTVGIVSAIGRTIKELNRFPFIQTDASINPGNSGGPLLNTKGYVIGVNTAIDARAQGIGFAIPSNYVKKIIGILKSGGTIQKAFLGLGLATINPKVARAYGINKRGVLVTSIEPGFPADQAGIKTNDIIFEFNNKKINNSEQFINLVQDTEVGKTVPLKALRQTGEFFEEKVFSVTLAEFPNPKKKQEKSTPFQYQGQVAPYNLGFSVVDSSSGARRFFNVPTNHPFAPIISHVEANSLAERAGLKTGMLVLETNGEEVNNSSDIIKKLNKSENKLTLFSESGDLNILIKNE
jgi:serine protease Do